MLIKDNETGRIFEYGHNCHDSLEISADGRYLTYYNLQNGDGSTFGAYTFVLDDGKTPEEHDSPDVIYNSYFNIGGFNR